MFLLRSSGSDKTTMKSDTGELDSSRDASPSEIFGQYLLKDMSECFRFSSCLVSVPPLFAEHSPFFPIRVLSTNQMRLY